MLNITTTPTGIHYRENLSAWMRLFIAIIGLGCGVMIPVVWISLADWSTLSFTAVVASLVSLATAAFGLLCVGIALLGVKTLEFDKARRVVKQTIRGPLQHNRSEIPFNRIERVETAMRDSENGFYPVLQMFVTGARHPIELVDVGDKASADAWRERIDKLIARP